MRTNATAEEKAGLKPKAGKKEGRLKKKKVSKWHQQQRRRERKRRGGYDQARFHDDNMELFDAFGNPIGYQTGKGPKNKFGSSSGKLQDNSNSGSQCCPRGPCRYVYTCCCSLCLALLFVLLSLVIYIYILGGKVMTPKNVSTASLSASVPIKTDSSLSAFQTAVVSSQFGSAFGQAVGTADDAVSTSFTDSKSITDADDDDNNNNGGDRRRMHSLHNSMHTPFASGISAVLQRHAHHLLSANTNSATKHGMEEESGIGNAADIGSAVGSRRVLLANATANATEFPVYALVNVTIGYTPQNDTTTTSQPMATTSDPKKGGHSLHSEFLRGEDDVSFFSTTEETTSNTSSSFGDLHRIVELMTDTLRMSSFLSGNYSNDTRIAETGDLNIESIWFAICYLKVSGEARFIKAGLQQRSIKQSTRKGLKDVEDGSDSIESAKLKQLWYLDKESHAGMTVEMKASAVESALCELHYHLEDAISNSESVANQVESFMTMDSDTFTCCWLGDEDIFTPYHSQNCVHEDNGRVDCGLYFENG